MYIRISRGTVGATRNRCSKPIRGKPSQAPLHYSILIDRRPPPQEPALPTSQSPQRRTARSPIRLSTRLQPRRWSAVPHLCLPADNLARRRKNFEGQFLFQTLKCHSVLSFSYRRVWLSCCAAEFADWGRPGGDALAQWGQRQGDGLVIAVA